MHFLGGEGGGDLLTQERGVTCPGKWQSSEVNPESVLLATPLITQQRPLKPTSRGLHEQRPICLMEKLTPSGS